jgi:hypothetical protein
MRRDKLVGIVLGGLVLILVLLAGLALAVMLLWNWLMPEIFGLPTLSFVQALGLTVLCHLLFKLGTGGGKGLGEMIRLGQQQPPRLPAAPAPPAPPAGEE